MPERTNSKLYKEKKTMKRPKESWAQKAARKVKYILR